MKTFIVVAAYNEEKKIERVLGDLIKHKYSNIVVVDDGSRDNTSKIAQKHPVTVLRHIINRGQGAALQTGINYALSKNADIIVTYDGDGQFQVKDIIKMTKPIMNKKANITLGSRFMGQAKNIPFLKKFVLKLGIIVVFVLYGIRVSDSQCGLRAFSKKAAKRINITADKMDHAGEIFHEIMRNKLKYIEVPITIMYDDYTKKKGQSWGKSIDLGIKMVLKRLEK